MIRDWRETTLTVLGERTVVRTEIGGRIKTQRQLEDAHTKAVKAAITAARVKGVEARYAELKSYAETVEPIAREEARRVFGVPIGPLPKYAAERVDRSVKYRVLNAHHDAETFLEREGKKAGRFEPDRSRDVRKLAAPWPKVRYVTPEQAKVTEYLDTDD